MTSLVLTVTETLRYRGALGGTWSWVLHRLTGLGVLLFFILHVIDTSWAVFYPGMYEHAISIYQTPLFTIGEFGLVFAVVYHAINGIRIAIFDYKPNWWKYQSRGVTAVGLITAAIIIPTFILMFGHVLAFYNSNPYITPLIEVLEAQLPFIAGMVIALVVAMLLSVGYTAITGKREILERPSALERFWWSYMRISGVLLLPLALGHLAMMHVIQGVFDLTAANFPVVGSALINASGTATEFTLSRWSVAVAGFYIWRIYDIALLAFAAIHGFNGLRYVLTDYISNPIIKRGAVYLCVIGAVALLIVGGAALISTADAGAIKMAQEALSHR